MQNGVMFDRARDDVTAFALACAQSRRAENRQIVAFRSTAGENNFAWFRFQHGRDTVTSAIEGRARLLTDVVDARRIAVNAVQVRQHGGAHIRIERRRRVVIEIDRAHLPNDALTIAWRQAPPVRQPELRGPDQKVAC